MPLLDLWEPQSISLLLMGLNSGLICSGPSFWAFWVSLPVSYVAMRWIVFGFGRSDWEAAPRFFVVQALTLVLNLTIAHILNKLIYHRGENTRRIIIAAAYMLSSIAAFLVLKFWVF